MLINVFSNKKYLLKNIHYALCPGVLQTNNTMKHHTLRLGVHHKSIKITY